MCVSSRVHCFLQLASENERLKEMLAKLQSGQDGGVTSCSGEPHIGADENTDVSSLVGCKWEQAAAAVVSEAGLPANESWCIGTNTEQESGQWDAYVPSATVKASMSYAVDPELAAQLIGKRDTYTHTHTCMHACLAQCYMQCSHARSFHTCCMRV